MTHQCIAISINTNQPHTFYYKLLLVYMASERFYCKSQIIRMTDTTMVQYSLNLMKPYGLAANFSLFMRVSRAFAAKIDFQNWNIKN